VISAYCIGQENLDLVNETATETINNYLSSKTWLERSKYVIQLPNTLEHMEERYDEINFEKELKDSTSYIYNVRLTFQLNSDPWLKIKGLPNYYKKKITVYYGAAKSKSNVTEYYVKNINGKSLIDWEASVYHSDVSLDILDNRKRKEYVMMRVLMKIEDNFWNKNDLPDYFAVRINQEGDNISKEAIIYKKSENGMKLYDQLIDGKWHKKVIWIKYFDCLTKQQKSLNKTIIDNRLIGHVNSIEFDNWIIENNQAGNIIRLSMEDPNLSNEIKKYESYLKVKELISNPSLKLKTLNAAKVEYYDKEIVVFGYINLDSYYNWGYRNSDLTHYSFKLKDENYETVHIYMNKLNSKKLFDELTNNEDLAVKIKGIPYKNKQEANFGNILIEGISFEILK
jgi:hypothetical protein